MNSPLEELVEWESLSLSHSFSMSVAVSGLLSCSHSGEIASVGVSWLKDVLIISVPGPTCKTAVQLYYSIHTSYYNIVVIL